MRIAIDGRVLTGRYTGDRTYWRNLLRVLPRLAPRDQFVIYSRTPVAPGELPPFPNVTYRSLAAPNERLWTLMTLPQALRAERADLVHVQYTIPPLCPCPIVTTVHDISFRLHPQWFPFRDRLLLNMTVPAAIRGAARVLTVSESSRDDILRIYPFAAGKVVATPLGLPPEFVRGITVVQEKEQEKEQENARQIAKTHYDLNSPFVLAVGVLQPRKNLRMLAEAFGRAHAAHGLPHQLALVGKAGWATEQDTLRQAAAEGGGAAAAAAVVFPGYVEDAHLPALYRACDAFAYPSLYEGFGIPPLEAMACGAPTLVSDAPPMPHHVADAALVVPATDVDAWATALGRILTDADLRADLAMRGPERAGKFTWETTAAQTLAVYAEVVRGVPKRRSQS